ncbi:MAG: hypothetical protein KatS3mg005_2729 [Bryobacteraceae bacterium]|nr:MAG: hypothetical protein KatS3mg005_2729 [Bryobacteraceae bacterium]
MIQARVFCIAFFAVLTTGFGLGAGNLDQCSLFAEGTVLRARLDHSVSTATHRAGDRFTATLAEPLRDGSRIVVPKGARVIGRLRQSTPSGRLVGRAVLSLVPERLEWNGRSVELETRAWTTASARHRRRNLAWIGGGSGAGAMIGALAAGGAGAAIGAGAGAAAGLAGAAVTGRKHAAAPAETLVTFRLRSPLQICQQDQNMRR